MKVGVASADYLRPDKSPTGKHQWGGAGWARVGQYLPFLEAAGHEVTVGTMWKYGDRIAVEDGYTGAMVEPDIVLIQRIMHDGVDETTRIARAAGQVVIHDVDDWYWGLDSRNAAWKATHPKYNKEENTTFYGRNIAAADMVISSTPFIASKVTERFGTPTVVLKNTVDVERFTDVEENDPPIVGWVGSTLHRSGDLELLTGIFPSMVSTGRIRLLHAGHRDDFPAFAGRLRLDDTMVETTPLRPSFDYPKMLTMNIGLVPLRDIPFNHAKSDIKGLEYAAAGIPFVASPLSAYQELYEDWGAGFILAKKPKDWIKGVNTLLDKQVRLDYKQALSELVWSRDIKRGAESFVELLESLV